MSKPDALRLADELDEPEYLMHKQAAEAAAELRRLHAQRDALLEALKRVQNTRVFVGAIAQQMIDAAIKAVEDNT